MHKLLKTGADFLFPPRCPVCDRVILPDEELCRGCEKELLPVLEPVCTSCGKPVGDERQEYCGDCAGKRHSFCQGKAVFVYRGGIRQSMYRFKYANRREYAQFYARYAVRLHGAWLRRKQVEVIVPIPMYRKKQKKRGYNQAEVFARALGRETGLPVEGRLLVRNRDTVPQKELNDRQKKQKKRGYNQAEVFARALGRETGLPVEGRLLVRNRDTVPQKELNDRQRRQNLKNAFQLVPDIVKYRKILLVDDIYTTGSTMDEAAKTLLAAGAEQVYYICVSIGAGF